MHWKRLLLVVPILLVVAFQACEDVEPPSGQKEIPEPIEGFPNTVGMLWKYQVYDSLTSTTDTVWVSITEQYPSVTILTDRQWRMAWQSSDSVVDLIASAMFDSSPLDFWTNPPQGEQEFVERFEFPLVEGAQWVGPIHPGDTSRVTMMRSTTVPAGTFAGVARVDRVKYPEVSIWGGVDRSSTWIDESAGIVKRYYRSEHYIGPGIVVSRNEVWELLEYDLTTFGQHQFPRAEGSEWVYELIDTANDLTDTVQVRIIDTIGLTGADFATVWTYTGREYVDTVVVANRGNEISVYPDTLAVMPFVHWDYEFPFAVGRNWGIYTFAAVPGVYDKGPVTTPAGEFEGSFHYRASGGALNDYWSLEERLVPGVGVVTRTFTKFGFWPAKNEVWTLLSYQIDP
jgi:hypothetical protein